MKKLLSGNHDPTYSFSFPDINTLHILKSRQRKPNVILILADDVGFECFSAYGSREYSTPRLDALASSGTRFNNCHSTPLCTPSRVNLLSGKSNVFNYFDFGIYPTGEPTFGTHFRDHGYATAVAASGSYSTKQAALLPKRPGLILTVCGTFRAEVGIATGIHH